MKYSHLLLGAVVIMASAGLAYTTISPRLETPTSELTTIEDIEITPLVATSTNLPEVTKITESPETVTTTTAPVSVPEPVVTPKPVPVPVYVPPAAPEVQGYTTSQVAEHNNQSSCWTIVNGNVYDVTSYISRHPGGAKNILKLCGKDGTSLFEGQHDSDRKPEAMLADLLIGPLI